MSILTPTEPENLPVVSTPEVIAPSTEVLPNIPPNPESLELEDSVTSQINALESTETGSLFASQSLDNGNHPVKLNVKQHLKRGAGIFVAASIIFGLISFTVARNLQRSDTADKNITPSSEIGTLPDAGNPLINQKLGVTVATNFQDDVNIDGQLTVKGKTVFGGTLTVAGDTVVGGNFRAGNIIGSGADLDNLNASNITQGTLADARLSTNVARLNGTQTFTGVNTFSQVLNQNGFTVCDSSNNCGFDSAGSGVTAVNGLSGSLVIQGTTNQITVGSGGTTITLSLPQDIALGSIPTFGGLNLTGNLSLGALNTFFGNSIQQTGVGNDVSINAGTDDILFTAGGRSFLFPTSGPANQVICSDGGNCASAAGGVTTSGGTINRLSKFTGAQTIGDSTISDDGIDASLSGDVTIQGGDITLGVANTSIGRIAFKHTGSANTGDIIQGALTANRTYALPDASGVIAVTASGNIALSATGDISFNGTLPVTSGGTGQTTFSTNGVLFGNGSGAVSNTIAPTAGQLLMGNGSGVPTFTSLSSDATIDSSGALTISADAINLGTDTTGIYVASITNGSGINGSSAIEGGSTTIELGNLTADWLQNGAFDLVLDNSASELKIRESLGAFYGSIDISDLSADQTYTFPNATGIVCLTSGNCASAGGGVSTAGGTTNRLAKFTGAQSIGDSTITDDGINVSLSGDLTVSGGDITSAGALNIGSGGTLTVGTSAQNVALQGAVVAITSFGSGGNIVVDSANNIELQDNTNITGALAVSTNTDISGTLFVGSADAFQVATDGSVISGTINGQTLTSVANFTGTLAYATQGITDSTNYVCRNSSNQLSSCSSSGAGASFIQGGNTFGAQATLGTNDAFSLAFETGGTSRWLIDTNGNFLPVTDDTYDIGSPTSRVRDLYLGPASLHIGVAGNDAVLTYDVANSRLELNQDLVITGNNRKQQALRTRPRFEQRSTRRRGSCPRFKCYSSR